jgi:transposase-like protein
METMTGHGAKLPRKKKQAITALLEQPSVAEAARVIGVEPQTLCRWMTDREFAAEYGAAKRAKHRHSMRRLGQGLTLAVKSVLQIMYHGKKPATRLKAACAVISLAKQANEIEDFAAAVVEAERIIKAGGGGKVGASERAPMTGHGAKFPRRKEQAIAALLVNRSIPEAASTADIGTQTLYTWMRQPGFIVEYAAAAGVVFGPAMRLVQHHVGDAVTVIRNLAVDPTIPEETRLQASLYIAEEMKAQLMDDLGERMAEMEVEASAGESQSISPIIGRSLHERLQRIKDRLLQASRLGGKRRMIIVHAIDGRPAGFSVKESDGRHIWLNPPEGCREGEPVTEQNGPLQDLAA